MILRKLAVRNYGCLGDGEWHFTEGVNVICGPNEAGKSTLAEAIAQVLLGSAPVTTTRPDLLERKTWGRQEMYRLEAEFFHEGMHWRIVRDYAKHEALLENLTTGEQVRDDARVRETLAKMARLTAGDPEKQYLATGYLKQGEWATVAEATGVTDLLAQAMEAAGGTRLRAAIEQLRKEREEYNRGVDRVAPKNPGPVASARAASEQAKEKLEGADGARAKAKQEEEARSALLQAEERLREIETELATLRPRLEMATQRQQLERDLTAAKKELGRLVGAIAQAEKLQGDIERWQRELQTRRPLTVKDVEELERKRNEAGRKRKGATDLREAAASTLAQVQELEAEAEKVSQEQVTLAPSGVSPVPLFGAVALTLVGVALLGAALALGAKLMLPARIVLAFLGAVMAAGGPVLVFRASAAARAHHIQLVLDRERRAREVAAQAEHMRGKAARLGQEADEADQEAAELEAQVEAQLTAWQMRDLASAREYAQYNEDLRAKINDARNQLEGALAGRQMDDLRREQIELQGKVADLQTRLSEPGMQAAAMSEAEYGELAQRVAALEEEHRHWTSKRAENEGWLRATCGAGEALLVLEEEARAAEAEYKAVERWRRVLNTAVGWIDAAVGRARQEAHETIVPGAVRFLQRLTAGRYRGLSVSVRRDRNEERLVPVVDAPEKGELAAPEELSYATREQVYLALRLAMCEALWPEEGPPLILDEPLLAFDETRRAAALELLRELGQRRQLVILTCSHDYDSIAANRIALAGAAT